ncbi:hypothetical protein GPROT1_03190 [Gammaproteobacteria bacterium]|nr:hypothetical protein GPROT1_03190 [Gammaproteobacteria bacterium]
MDQAGAGHPERLPDMAVKRSGDGARQRLLLGEALGHRAGRLGGGGRRPAHSWQRRASQSSSSANPANRSLGVDSHKHLPAAGQPEVRHLDGLHRAAEFGPLMT